MQFRKRFTYMFISLVLLILVSCSKDTANEQIESQAITNGINVVKNVMGANGTFNLTVSRPGTTSFALTTATTVGGAAGTGTAARSFSANPNWDGISAAPTAGLYSVAEPTVPSGYVLLPIVCKGNNATTTTVDDRSMPANAIYLKASEIVICTVTNATRGIIKVVKKSVGDSGTFSFNSNLPGATTFDLTTPVLTTGSSSSFTRTFNNLVAGTYEVTETVPAGWNSSVVCKGDNLTPAITADDVTYPSDELILDKGETITCTFTNVKKSTLTIVKNTVGGDGPFTFTSTNLPGRPFTVTTTAGIGQSAPIFITLTPTYNLAETVTAGWALTSSECKRNNATPANATDDVVIALNAIKATKSGEAIVCTFNNIALRDVTLTKQVEGGPEGAEFALTLNCGTEALTASGSVGDDGVVTVLGVPVGTTCTATETPPGDDWTVLGDGGTLAVSEAGPNALTITNTYGALRTVKVTKDVATNVPAAAPAQDFTVTVSCTGADPVTDAIADGEFITVPGVSVGSTCSVTEDDVTDWNEGTVADFTVSATSEDNEKILTNTYAAVRTVTLTKEVEPNAFGAIDNTATFNITLDCGELSDNNDSATDSGTATVADVPVGTVCTASEVDPGTDWTVVGVGGTVTVSAAGPNALTITNTYAAVRDVVVNKNLFSSVPASAPDGDFGVTLECSINYGPQTITTSEGTGSTTFTGIPVGEVCDVTEPDSPDWTEGTDSLTVTADTNTADIANTYTAVRDIDVTKTVVDAEFAPATTFTLNLSCNEGSFTDSDTIGLAGGTVTFEDVPVGSDCDISETDLIDWTEGSASLEVVEGSNTATITNTYVAAGSITVVKNTVGGEGTFEFVDTGSLGSFDLETASNSASQTFSGLTAGPHSISETAQSDWVQTSAICTGGNDTDPASITLQPGENLTCTFTNTAKGTIVIVKNTVGGNSTFSFTGDLGNFSLATVAGTKTRTFSDVVAGSYSVTESAKAGWTFTSLLCADSDSEGVDSTESGTVSTINLDPGETVTCTYTNTKNPQSFLTFIPLSRVCQRALWKKRHFVKSF